MSKTLRTSSYMKNKKECKVVEYPNDSSFKSVSDLQAWFVTSPFVEGIVTNVLRGVVVHKDNGIFRTIYTELI